MIADRIKEMLQQEPFRRFAIRAGSGKPYVVANPDFVVMMKSSLVVAAPNSDRAATVPYLHIAAVEEMPGGNGHRKPRRRR
jgi:hypothetical protein